MSIYEYDAERHLRQEREAEYERGMADGITQGMEQGREQGERNKLWTQIQKKLAKGKSISRIADELEESEQTIQEIIEHMQQKSNTLPQAAEHQTG